MERRHWRGDRMGERGRLYWNVDMVGGCELDSFFLEHTDEIEKPAIRWKIINVITVVVFLYEDDQMMRLHIKIWYTALYLFYIFFFLLLPLAPTLEHRADLSVSWSFTDGRTPWTGDQLIARPLPKHRTTRTHQTSMPWMGFELTIPASERMKTVHALSHSAAVTGILHNTK
jgi:hypothetical protein